MADNDHLPSSKKVRLGEYSFRLAGVSIEDPYWQSVHDDFEPEFQNFCRRLIQRDYVCLDIGANIGVKTLFLSRHCANGRVISLEAGRKVAATLARNIALNECTNAISYHAAAAGHDGTLTFDEASAWGHQDKGGVTVEAMTLETLVSRNSLDRVDFIKLDVEGGEFPVLKSSLDLINRFESLVHVELNSLTLLVWGNTNPREFIEWIGNSFSEVYAITRKGSNKPLLTRVETQDQCGTILHRNLIDDGCVTDLVMSNSPYRFEPVPQHFEDQIIGLNRQAADMRQRIAALKADLAALEADLNASRSEASSLKAERAALLASTSWRISAPIRWLKTTGSRSPT